MKTLFAGLLLSFMLVLSACMPTYHLPANAASATLYTGSQASPFILSNGSWKQLQVKEGKTLVPVGRRITIQDVHTTSVYQGDANEYISCGSKLSFLPIKNYEYLLDYNLVGQGCSLQLLKRSGSNGGKFKVDNTVRLVK